MLLIAALVLASPLQGGEEPLIDFEALGAAFLEEHCGSTTTEACLMEDVLAKHFAHVDIGLFEVQFPVSMLSEKGSLADLGSIVHALGETAQHWAAWQGAEFPDTNKAWSKWIGKWKPLKKKQLEQRESSLLLDLVATDEDQRALLDELEALCDSEELALRIPEGRQVRLILAPTRLDFMRWNGYAGLVDESLRPFNWHDDAAEWTQLWFGWDLVLALQYSPWTGFDPTFETFQPMANIGAGVMAQHVVQQATLALLRQTRPTVPETRYDSALALLMVIQSCGEVNTIDGAGGVSSSGGMTSPYEKFVPGGNSAGGLLPGRSAEALNGIVENQWRRGHGTDGFVGPLKKGQKEAGKKAKKLKADVLSHFILTREDGTGEHLIHAPFFGPHANDQEYPPGDYLVDYAEFYRSYKVAFLHWLATSGPDAEASSAKWNELARGMASLDATKTLDTLLEEVYGLPVSAKDGSTDSLEWRFLKALPKLK